MTQRKWWSELVAEGADWKDNWKVGYRRAEEGKMAAWLLSLAWPTRWMTEPSRESTLKGGQVLAC